MVKHVTVVLKPSPPGKVFNPIVAVIAIQMPRDHTGQRQPDERLQHESMDAARLAKQTHRQVKPVAGGRSVLHPLTSSSDEQERPVVRHE